MYDNEVHCGHGFRKNMNMTARDSRKRMNERYMNWIAIFAITGSPSKSPTRSPIKSPRKGRSKAKDVLTVPKPYCNLKSDQIKKWNKELIEKRVIGADNEAEQELFNSIKFTNALVLKVNQLAKQVSQTDFIQVYQGHPGMNSTLINFSIGLKNECWTSFE